MKNTNTNSGHANVRLVKGQYILCELVGYIDENVSIDSLEKTRRLADALHADGKPVYLMIDGSAVTDQSSGARRATKMLADMGIEKIAVCGAGITVGLVAQYLMRAIRVTERAKAFRSRARGEYWLLRPSKKMNGDVAGVVIGSLIIATLSLIALTGWVLNDRFLTELTPHITVMNPVVAVTFLLLAAVSPLLIVATGLSKNRRLVAYWVVGIIVAWTTVFSISIWVRTVYGTDLHLDKLLFADRVGADALAAPRTVFSFMLVVVMLLAVLTGQHHKWERFTFYIAETIVMLSTLVTAVGYAFGFTLADITNFIPMSLTTALCFMALVQSMRSLTKPLPWFIRVQSYLDKHRLAIIVFTAGIVLSGVLWQQSKLDLSQNVDAKVIETFQKQRDGLTSRINAYGSLLYSTRSLFEASDDVSPDEFTIYFSSSGTLSYLPGLNGIAYSKAIPAADRQSHQNTMRKEPTVLNPQLSKFTIHPASGQSTSYVITYIEPDKTNVKDALGFDLGTSDQRRVVLESSRDSGRVESTGTIDINSAVQGDAPEKPGFFMTAPIYSNEIAQGEPQTVAERRARLSGFVNASFVYDELFADIFKDETATDVRYVVSDVETRKALYTYNPSATDIGPEVKYEGNVDFGNRIWNVAMYTKNTFGSTVPERILPVVVLVGGIVLTLMATSLIASVSRKREAAAILAEAMTEDLNAERNAAVAARNNNETILASIGDAVFVVDDKERITLFNHATEAISGYTAEEALGKPYKEILKFAYVDEARPESTFIQRALKGYIAHMRNHTILVRKDGKKIAVADSAAPLRDEGGKIGGAIIVFRDVTRETELNRAKDEFVSLASHQLRTPLSAVKWYSEMLLNGDVGKLNKGQQEHMQEIYEGNERMIMLVNSLLSVSRIDLGKFINEPVEVSIPKLVSSLETEMANQISSKKLKVKTKFYHDLPVVFVDPKLLRIIIQNLISNSIKYTPNGGAINVVAKPAQAGECSKTGVHSCDKYVTLTVADSGRGIPKAQQDRIFEKLFRADNVRALDVEGTGLGLYLVKQIVERLGGKIWFESQENVESTFSVMLPIHTKKVMPERDTITTKKVKK